MANWNGGFTGEGYTREQFRHWLTLQNKPAWAKFLAVHNTAAPYIKPPVVPAARIKNLGAYYKSKGWAGGPQLFVIFDRVYPGTPIDKMGVHSPSWNKTSIGVECEGDYDGTHDPLKGDGAIAWDTMAWVFAEVMAWLGLKPGADTIRLHREDKKTTHACPGKLVQKDWFIAKVLAAGGAPAPVDPAPRKTVWIANVPPGDFLNTRKGPGTQFEVNGKLPNGTKLDVIEEAGSWTYVKTPAGHLVWVSARYLSNSAPAAPVPPKPERMPVADMHMSQKGLDLLKHFEGLRLAPYDDRGSPAIGYGHSNRSKKPPVVTPELRITPEEALQILANDLVDYETRVKASVKVPLKQGEFDALVSLAYNWGPGNLDRSNLMKLVNAGEYAKAKAEILTILPSPEQKHYAGIKRRRGEEAALFGG